MQDEQQEPAAAEAGDDELHRRFREALEKKKAARHDPHGEGTSAKGVGPASNDKRKREFRRKSGG